MQSNLPLKHAVAIMSETLRSTPCTKATERKAIHPDAGLPSNNKTGAATTPSTDPVHTLFQISTSGALVAGVYQGVVSTRLILEHGDFGLGHVRRSRRRDGRARRTCVPGTRRRHGFGSDR
ncbi:MAG: acetolactate decarboxylase [Pararobbsia sp.]